MNRGHVLIGFGAELSFDEAPLATRFEIEGFDVLDYEVKQRNADVHR